MTPPACLPSGACQAKMLKCAGNDDIITMKADDQGDTVTFMFENKGACSRRRGAAPRGQPGGRQV